MREIKVKWTGEYPCLCHGQWEIEINNKKIIDKENYIEKEDRYEYGHFLCEEMNTKKEYSKWHFDKNYSEEWETYEDGLEYDEWIKTEKKEKLEKILEKNNIKLTKEDWRHGSCGGCI